MEYEITDYGLVSFEEIARSIWIVRGHTLDDGFGNPYDWAFVLIKNGQAGIAKGMVGENMPSSSKVKAIRDFASKNGIKNIEYTRVRRSGNTRHILK